MPSWQDDVHRYPVPGLTTTELAVLRAIVTHTDWDRSGAGARQGQPTIAQATDLSTRSVRRATRTLEGLGLVATVVGTGRTTTRYRVNVPALLDRMGRLLDPGPTSAPTTRADTVSALGGQPVRSDRTPCPPTTTTPPPRPTSRAPVDQLVLALLEATTGESSIDHLTAPAIAAAAAAAAALPPGTDPDDVRCARDAWRRLGRDPRYLTARTLVRDWPAIAPEVKRQRHRHTPRASCGACDSGWVVGEDGAPVVPAIRCGCMVPA